MKRGRFSVLKLSPSLKEGIILIEKSPVNKNQKRKMLFQRKDRVK